MLEGDVGPMSKMRRFVSCWRCLCMVAHALECLGTRGPESIVGLPERASPALLFPNSLRSTISSAPRGRSLRLSPRRRYYLRAGVAGCDPAAPAEAFSVEA